MFIVYFLHHLLARARIQSFTDAGILSVVFTNVSEFLEQYLAHNSWSINMSWINVERMNECKGEKMSIKTANKRQGGWFWLGRFHYLFSILYGLPQIYSFSLPFLFDHFLLYVLCDLWQCFTYLRSSPLLVMCVTNIFFPSMVCLFIFCMCLWVC